MNTPDDEIRGLLRQALPPVETDSDPGRDLWPAVVRRMDAEAARQTAGRQTRLKTARSQWVWLDWMLLAGLAVLAVVFPASIPLLLYYL